MDDLRFLHDDQVFGRREALEHGYVDDDLQLGVRVGSLVRVRHGSYTFADVWAAADEVERHRLRAHAVMRSHSTRIALSHTPAPIEHGLTVFEADPRRVHVTCLDKPLARSTPDIVYHEGNCPDEALTIIGSHLVVEPVR